MQVVFHLNLHGDFIQLRSYEIPMEFENVGYKFTLCRHDFLQLHARGRSKLGC